MTRGTELLPLPLTTGYEPDCAYPEWVNTLLTDYARANVTAALASAQAREEELRRRLEVEESDHGRTIDQRDEAEDALGEMFQAVTGRSAEWSSAWGYMEAIEEAADHVYTLQQRAERLAEALRGMVGAAYPVCTSIDPRGHRWCEPYLDEALPAARAAISTNAATQTGETNEAAE